MWKKVWEGFGKVLGGFGNLDFDFEILEMHVFKAKLSSSDQVGCYADGGARGLPCKSREAALAADLITA